MWRTPKSARCATSTFARASYPPWSERTSSSSETRMEKPAWSASNTHSGLRHGTGCSTWRTATTTRSSGWIRGIAPCVPGWEAGREAGLTARPGPHRSESRAACAPALAASTSPTPTITASRWRTGASARSEAGSLHLEPLLLRLALGEEEQSVSSGEVIQRLGNAGQQLQIDLHDPPAEVHHVLEVAGFDGVLRQSLIGLAKVASEGRGAIPMDVAVEALDLIEGGTDLLAAERRMREKVDEVLDRLLEVHVVFPQRVVAVDDQDLSPRHRCGQHSHPECRPIP